MGLILGLDGGGSKTLLALATQSGEVVRVERTLGLDPANGAKWRTRLGALLRSSGISGISIDGAALGLSSHGEIEAQDAVQRRTVSELLGPAAVIDNDVRVAFDGAFAGGAGVLLLSGTGSMAWASDGGGRHVRAGGWGEAFGDEGSAFWIGREALSLATRALDNRHPARGFSEALLARIGVGPADLLTWAAGLDDRRAGFASLARFVSELAEAGDAAALALLDAAAAHVAAHAGAAEALLDAARPVAWSYAGGVFSSPLFLASVARHVGRPPALPRLPPVGGALLRAAESAGWTTDDAFIDRLAGTLATRLLPS